MRVLNFNIKFESGLDDLMKDLTGLEEEYNMVEKKVNGILTSLAPNGGGEARAQSYRKTNENKFVNILGAVEPANDLYKAAEFLAANTEGKRPFMYYPIYVDSVEDMYDRMSAMELSSRRLEKKAENQTNEPNIYIGTIEEWGESTLNFKTTTEDSFTLVHNADNLFTPLNGRTGTVVLNLDIDRNFSYETKEDYFADILGTIYPEGAESGVWQGYAEAYNTPLAELLMENAFVYQYNVSSGAGGSFSVYDGIETSELASMSIAAVSPIVASKTIKG